MSGSFMHGPGTLEWKDGRKYTGQFRYNEMVLPGTLTLADGSTRSLAADNNRAKSSTVVTWPDGQANAIQITTLLKQRSDRAEIWELIERQGSNERRMTIKLSPNGFRVVGKFDRDYIPDATRISQKTGVFVRNLRGDYLSAKILGAETLDDIRFVANLSTKNYSRGTSTYKEEGGRGRELALRAYNRAIRAETYTANGKRVGLFLTAGNPPDRITVSGQDPTEVVGSPPLGENAAIRSILHVAKHVGVDAK